MNPTPRIFGRQRPASGPAGALHRIPEPAHAEHRTQRFILENLQGTGADSVECVGTGVKAVYRAPRPSGTLCFRADMDALRVTEENEVPYASQSPGLMHACGHDGHMAVLLAFAALLRSHRDRMVNDIVLLFQPAEESVGGAKGMVEAGVLRDPDVDSVFGLHLMPHIPQGRIGLRPGALMAAARRVRHHRHGQERAAMPHGRGRAARRGAPGGADAGDRVARHRPVRGLRGVHQEGQRRRGPQHRGPESRFAGHAAELFQSRLPEDEGKDCGADGGP